MPGRRSEGLAVSSRDPPPHEPGENEEDTEMGDISDADPGGSNRASRLGLAEQVVPRYLEVARGLIENHGL
ncbi:hypothetical protein LTR28_013899 [Elasticomyces elasticus]|nr:hypothetical protein LTR28_013899 [Elasticomyces elasticus]